MQKPSEITHRLNNATDPQIQEKNILQDFYENECLDITNLAQDSALQQAFYDTVYLPVRAYEKFGRFDATSRKVIEKTEPLTGAKEIFECKRQKERYESLIRIYWATWKEIRAKVRKLLIDEDAIKPVDIGEVLQRWKEMDPTSRTKDTGEIHPAKMLDARGENTQEIPIDEDLIKFIEGQE